MAQSLSTINPDFEDLVTQLRNKLATMDSWRDLLTTSTGQTLLEFVAAVGELDQYAIERVFQEMFSETARLDSSIYGITKMLGVRIARKSPAVVAVEYMPIGGPDPANGLKRKDSLSYPLSVAFTIPPYSQFTSDKGLLFNRDAILFDANVAYGYQLDSDGVTRKDIELFEGTVNLRSYQGTGADFFSIISVEENFVISDSDVVVKVNTVEIPRQENGLWNNNNSTAGWQDLTTSKGQLHVLFGTKVSGGSSSGFGTVPTAGDTIDLMYVTTKGSAGNASFNSPFTSCSTFSGLIDSTQRTLVNGLTGGGNQRSAADYQRLAPRIFASDQGERAVTQQDYDAVASDYPGIIDVRTFGQRDTNPSRPSFMNFIKVVTYPKFGTSVSGKAAYNNFLDFLAARTMYSMNFYPVTDDPLYNAEPYTLPLGLTASVFCNNLADLNDVRDNYILPAILALVDMDGSPAIGRISRNVFRSDIIAAIKNSHPSIDYVQLTNPTQDIIAELDPPALTLTPVNVVGGLLPAGTYYYWITMTNAVGETRAEGPYAVTTTGADNAVQITWTPPPYALAGQYTGFTIYGRGLMSQGYLNSVGYNVSTFTDDFSITPTSPLPEVNTTGVHIVLLPSNWSSNIANNITMAYSTRT